MKTFFLGNCAIGPHWLRTGPAWMPLFFSYPVVKKLKGPLSRAQMSWALDSGGYTLRGYTVTPQEYFDDAQRYQEQAGNLRWASCQDWMCTPRAMEQTGITVLEAQERTLNSFQWLRARPSSVRFIPILQGWVLSDYLRHLQDYERAGYELTREPVVGVGSLRGNKQKDLEIIRELHLRGLRLHAFGSSFQLMESGMLESADSTRWSQDCRRDVKQKIKLGWKREHYYRPSMPSCKHKGDCASCIDFAAAWYRIRIEPVLQRHAMLRRKTNDALQSLLVV